MLDDLPESALLLLVSMQAGILLLLSAEFLLGLGFLFDRLGVLRLSKSAFGLSIGLLITRLLFGVGNCFVDCVLLPNRMLL